MMNLVVANLVAAADRGAVVPTPTYANAGVGQVTDFVVLDGGLDGHADPNADGSEIGLATAIDDAVCDGIVHQRLGRCLLAAIRS